MLKWDLDFHLKHFKMPAWTRLMEKSVKDHKCESLWVAFDHLTNGGVKDAETDDSMTMNDMVAHFRMIVKEARAWNNQRAREQQQPMIPWESEDWLIQELCGQDCWGLREKVGPKTQDEVALVRDLPQNLGF